MLFSALLDMRDSCGTSWRGGGVGGVTSCSWWVVGNGIMTELTLLCQLDPIAVCRIQVDDCLWICTTHLPLVRLTNGAVMSTDHLLIHFLLEGVGEAAETRNKPQYLCEPCYTLSIYLSPPLSHTHTHPLTHTFFIYPLSVLFTLSILSLPQSH